MCGVVIVWHEHILHLSFRGFMLFTCRIHYPAETLSNRYLKRPDARSGRIYFRVTVMQRPMRCSYLRDTLRIGSWNFPSHVGRHASRDGLEIFRRKRRTLFFPPSSHNSSMHYFRTGGRNERFKNENFPVMILKVFARFRHEIVAFRAI